MVHLVKLLKFPLRHDLHAFAAKDREDVVPLGEALNALHQCKRDPVDDRPPIAGTSFGVFRLLREASSVKKSLCISARTLVHRARQLGSFQRRCICIQCPWG